MCGLVGYSGKKPANPLYLAICGFYNDSRGGDSVGWIDSNNLIKKSTNPSTFSKVLQKDKIDVSGNSDIIIMHSRKRSSGFISLDGAHPFNIENKIVGAHNGTITNERELIDYCEKYYPNNADIDRVRLNRINTDSELFFTLLTLTSDLKLFELYDGGAVFMWKNVKDETLNIFKGQSEEKFSERPLFSMRTKDGIYFSSMSEPFEIINQLEGKDYKIESLDTNKIFIYKEGKLVNSIITNRQIIVKPTYQNHRYAHMYGNYEEYDDSRYYTKPKELPSAATVINDKVQPNGKLFYINEKLKYCRNGHVILDGIYRKEDDNDFTYVYNFKSLYEPGKLKNIESDYGKKFFGFFGGYLINTDFVIFEKFLNSFKNLSETDKYLEFWKFKAFGFANNSLNFFQEVTVDSNSKFKFKTDFDFAKGSESKLKHKGKYVSYKFLFCSYNTTVYVNKNNSSIARIARKEKTNENKNIFAEEALIDLLDDTIDNSLLKNENFYEIIIKLSDVFSEKYLSGLNSNDYYATLYDFMEIYLGYYLMVEYITLDGTQMEKINVEVNEILTLLNYIVDYKHSIFTITTKKKLTHLKRSYNTNNVFETEEDMVTNIQDYYESITTETGEKFENDEKELKRLTSMEFTEKVTKKLKELQDLLDEYDNNDLDEDAQKKHESLYKLLNNSKQKELM